jgi:hypothetical protein
MGASEETIELLKRIATATEKLVQLMQRPSESELNHTRGGECASEQDLDGQYGDPELKKDPPRWKGQRYAPCRMSDTCPEYLDELASFYDWQAGKDDEAGKTAGNGKPSSSYKRRDAARARGWAKRLRAGWKPAKPADDYNAIDDDSNTGGGW